MIYDWAADFTSAYWLAVAIARKQGVIERRLDPIDETERTWWL
jgi:hypothetical protein